MTDDERFEPDGQRHVLKGVGDDEGIWMDDTTIHVELYYPRAVQARTKVTVGMTDIRSADDLTITYDHHRDGWAITREIHEEIEHKVQGVVLSGEMKPTGQWIEVAFVPAYTMLVGDD